MIALRYALRSLAKSPGFVAVAILALGFGLGLSTTMFAVLDAVVNPYTAYRKPDQLHFVRWWLTRPMTSGDLYRILRSETRSFQGVVPIGGGRMRIEAGGEGTDVYAQRVPARYFELVGVRPWRGRVFTASDGEDVVLLGRDQWRRLFGTRRSLEGATVTVNGQPRAVIGVLPRGAADNDVLLPLAPSAEEAGELPAGVQSLVRLKDGVTAERANDELKVLARLLTDRLNARDRPIGLDLSPLVWRNENIRDIHKAMVGSALAVLLIACVNLAHLMLARGLAKRRELALRMALGASRAAVVRLMLAECALITAAGAAVGALVTLWGTYVLRHQMPRSVSWVGLVQPQMSWRVFALAALAAAAAAALFGLVPAIRVALDLNLDEPLKTDAGTTTGRVRQRYSPLVVAEVALALVLMMGGGLLLRTLIKLQRERLGFDSRNLYAAQVFLRRTRDSTVAVRRPEVLGAVSAVPGVEVGAMINTGRAPGGMVSAELTGDSSRTLVVREYGLGRFPVVSPEFLRVLGLPVLKGRDFEPGDAAGRGVAILDPIAARQLYPNQDPVGHMLKLGGPGYDAPWVPIVGVVRSPYVLEAAGRYSRLPSVFIARAESTVGNYLVIRTSTPSARTAAAIQSRLAALPGVQYAQVRPYDWVRQQELASRAFLAKVFVTLGAVALGLAVLGLYGVLAYAVTRRRREFGVRIALGAEPAALLRMVLHDGLVMLLAGIGAGAFVALAAARLLDAVLIAVLPSDLLSLVVCEAVLLAAGLTAAIYPARRAARANPLDILRAV